ncbi:hypothetical protein Hanom_Chr10g00929111 [Helianthus anomalus]
MVHIQAIGQYTCLFFVSLPTTNHPLPANRRHSTIWFVHVHFLLFVFMIFCEVSAFCLPDDDGGLLIGMETLVATIAPLSGLNDDDNLIGSEL